MAACNVWVCNVLLKGLVGFAVLLATQISVISFMLGHVVVIQVVIF